MKCKFLPLAKWRRQLQQTDLPAECQYFVVSDHLDMVGVQLRATWVQTRKENGGIVLACNLSHSISDRQV